MVNFRYHLVSLIAVFLALAAGVVLGAGPLQNAVSRMGTNETAAYEREQAEANLQKLGALSEQGNLFVEAVAEQVLPEKLAGASVAVVVLPGASTRDIDLVLKGLQMAGAAVQSEVFLTEHWVEFESNTYRQTLSEPISANLTERPADTSADGVLAQGLVEVLTLAGASSELIFEIMTNEETPLIEAGRAPGDPADHIVLVGPTEPTSESGKTGENQQSAGGAADESTTEDTSSNTAENTSAQEIAWLSLARASAATPGLSVAVGQAASDGDFIALLRREQVQIATVDQGGNPISALNTPLALAAGKITAYGQQEGASTVLAPFSAN